MYRWMGQLMDLLQLNDTHMGIDLRGTNAGMAQHLARWRSRLSPLPDNMSANFTFNRAQLEFDITIPSVTTTSVPEPSSFGIIALGLIGLRLRRRKPQ